MAKRIYLVVAVHRESDKHIEEHAVGSMTRAEEKQRRLAGFYQATLPGKVSVIIKIMAIE